MMHGVIRPAAHRLRMSRSVLVTMLVCVPSTAAVAQQQSPAPACRTGGPVIPLPGLPEASGIAVSRSVPGRLWTHNDSGQPILFALDARGNVTGQVRLSGAGVRDWEAIAVGPCPTGSCIYVGDIGDNKAKRTRITVYRLPEPPEAATVAATEALHATYPDGAHDAEALLITPAGDLLIVTKGDTGPVALYRFPRELRPGATHQLERVGQPRAPGKPVASERITDGAVSADGRWVVLRTTHRLTFHQTAELIDGNWREARSVDVTAVGETQGEGVAMGADGTVYLAGEGGRKSRPGTFARLDCTKR